MEAACYRAAAWVISLLHATQLKPAASSDRGFVLQCMP